MKIQTKIAVLFCISILAMTLGGCKSFGDMAEENAVSVGTEDRKTANKGTGANEEWSLINTLADETIGLSLGEVCQEALNDYDRIFKCFNRAVTSCGIPGKESQEMYQKLMDSKILDEENMCLTGMVFNDYDRNGERDMLVCLYKDTEDSDDYKDGCLYLFMNEEEPYYIYDDFCCYYYGLIFGDFGADVDHDGNTEIVFCVQGIGVGGTGDCQKFLIKYKDKEIERMEIPSDFADDYDSGLQVEIGKDVERGVYNVYCPYLDETVIVNTEEEEDWRGGNSRGYYNLKMTWYQGEEHLVGYEYLYTGSIVHGVGSAVFVFDWDENGAAYVKDWYVEDWDGKIYLPFAKITAPLFDETQNSEEVRAYEAFLAGKLTAHIDDKIYADTSHIEITATDSEGLDKAGEGFYVEELMNEIVSAARLDGWELYTHIGSVQYALIDCGGDGKKQLALRAYGLGIYARDDDSDLTMVFDYKNGKVVMVYAVDSWARRRTELYKNGYVCGFGSDGATSNYEWEGIIKADGVYHESFQCHMWVGGSEWEFLDRNDRRRYQLESKTYSINGETVYSYDIDGADITEEERQGALECIQKEESSLGADILSDDKAWEFVEKNRKNLGITEGMNAEENKIDWRVLPRLTALLQ